MGRHLMLEAIQRVESEAEDIAPALAAERSASRPIAAVAVARSGYGAERSINLPAVVAVGLIHVALIAAMVQMRTAYVRHKDADLTVVNLTPPAPPPPAEEPPPPAPPQVVAPPPIVQVPQVPVPIMTTPEPLPIIAPVAAAPTPAPPAPVAPAAPAAPVQSNDLMLRMIAGKPPRYPTESRRLREQGTVVLAVIVGTDGRVQSISISRSSGFARLDDAARDAVKGWRWEPLIRNGVAVQVRGPVEFPFVLKG